jgi:hypothetical protein
MTREVRTSRAWACPAPVAGQEVVPCSRGHYAPGGMEVAPEGEQPSRR